MRIDFAVVTKDGLRMNIMDNTSASEWCFTGQKFCKYSIPMYPTNGCISTEKCPFIQTFYYSLNTIERLKELKIAVNAWADLYLERAVRYPEARKVVEKDRDDVLSLINAEIEDKKNETVQA